MNRYILSAFVSLVSFPVSVYGMGSQVKEVPYERTMGRGPFSGVGDQYVCDFRETYRRALDAAAKVQSPGQPAATQPQTAQPVAAQSQAPAPSAAPATQVPPAAAAQKVDPFCNKKNMEENNIIVRENEVSYLILNTNPFTNPFTNVGYHLLWIPKRHADHVTDLTEEELFDMKETCTTIERRFGSEAIILRFAVNDGEHAGQSVKHFHLNIIVRTAPLRTLQGEQEEIDTNEEYKKVLELSQKDRDAAIRKRLKDLAPLIQTKLADQLAPLTIPSYRATSFVECSHCWFGRLDEAQDEKQLVAYRDEDFIAVAPSNSNFSGQISLVPVLHYGNLFEMGEEKTKRFYALLSALSQIIPETAHELIRDCDASNFEVVSFGEKSKETANWNPELDHVSCLITPRMATKRPCYIDFNGGGYHPFKVRAYYNAVRLKMAEFMREANGQQDEEVVEEKKPQGQEKEKEKEPVKDNKATTAPSYKDALIGALVVALDKAENQVLTEKKEEKAENPAQSQAVVATQQ